ncbi:MAG: hypothetical protein A2293_14615 [Elusimicrobia bacterium RIFOXYB2_FULL_49_7]|nr:MAG: hypothetical protein A2293_14615 [Elusimicrobia bacterium RIFOXYB2_FULL_49_7]
MMTAKPTRALLLRSGAWYFFLHSFIVMLFALCFLRFAPLPKTAAAVVYLTIMTLGHFAALSFLPYLALFAPLVLLFPKKRLAAILLILISGAMLFLLVIDFYVFSMYRFHLNGWVLEMLVGPAAGEVFEFSNQIYLFCGGLLAALFGLETVLVWLFLKSDWASRFRHGRIIAIMVPALMLSGHLLHAVADAMGYRPITQVSRVYPLLFPLQAKKFFYKLGWIDPARNRDMDLSVKGGDKGLSYPLHPLVFSRPERPLNILWIVIDSWNVRCMNDSVTPHISAFARDNLRFTTHRSGSNGTRGGIFTLFYGIPALYWYEAEAGRISPLFLDALIEQGYDLNLLASASLSNPPFDKTVFCKIRNLSLSTPGETSADRDDRIATGWKDWMADRTSAKRASPFFGFLFFDAPHALSLPKGFSGPFQPSWEYAQYQKLALSAESPEYFNLYCNTLYFDDSLIGGVLSDLKENGLYDNTVIVITGDHGQEFNENKKGYWGHNGNFSCYQIGVPLVIHWPGQAAEDIDKWTTHYDITPTLLIHALGCRNPVSDMSVGLDLLDSTMRDWSVAGSKENFAIIDTDRITTIGYSGDFTITTPALDPLPDAILRVSRIDRALKKINAFQLK